MTRLLCLACLLALVPLAALMAPAGFVLGTATLTSFKLSGTCFWNYETTVAGLTNTTANSNSFSFSLSTTNGTGAAGTADLIYAVQTTISGGGNTSIDVSGGVSDFFGTTVTMARVKVFYINLTTATTASSVSIGNATNPIVNWISASTSTVKVNNGGLWIQGDTGATGYAVTAATGDNLKILNNDGSNTATLNICIVGSSA